MKEDRRVRHTKKSIRDAMLKLLKEKPLSKITVKEICDIADINRSTYYTYYSDPYDQFEAFKKEMSEEFKEMLTANANSSQYEIIRLLCGLYLNRREEYLLLLTTCRSDELDRFMLNSNRDIVKTYWDKSGHNYTDEEQEYVYRYSVAGTNAVIIKWLSDDYERISPDDFAMLLKRIDEKGIYG